MASIKCLTSMTNKERANLNIIILKTLRGALDSNMTPAQIKMKLVMVFWIKEIMKFRKRNQIRFGMRNEKMVDKNSFNKEQQYKPIVLRFYS